MRIMPTETELALEQSQQGVSYEVSISIEGVITKMILILKTSRHGPSDAMHNPSQLLRLLSKQVCFISHGDQHASIGFLILRSLILK
ncbi:hypothetical protein Tco_0263341, partial [Tanacetum coccineum]